MATIKYDDGIYVYEPEEFELKTHSELEDKIKDSKKFENLSKLMQKLTDEKGGFSEKKGVVGGAF